MRVYLFNIIYICSLYSHKMLVYLYTFFSNYIKIIFDKSGGNIVRDCASWLTKTVGGGRSTYRFSIPQNYLSENGINYPGVGGDNKPMRNISFTMQLGGKLYVVCEGSVAVFDMAALGLE